MFLKTNHAKISIGIMVFSLFSQTSCLIPSECYWSQGWEIAMGSRSKRRPRDHHFELEREQWQRNGDRISTSSRDPAGLYVSVATFIKTTFLSLSLSLSLTHTHTHTHTLSLSLSHTHTHTHSLSHTLTLSLTHTHTHTHSLTHTLLSLSQTDTHTDTLTDRQTDTLTDRQTDRHTHTLTDRHTHSMY